MPEIDNGAAGRLVIPGVHDGRCGIAAGAPLTVAFRWARTGRRPELVVAAGAGALLDGVAHDIVSIARSPLSEGFYLAVLAPTAPGIARQL